MRIEISIEDLPLLRFIKRNQLFTACLRYISEHPSVRRMEAGSAQHIELECEVNRQEQARLSQLVEWWDKAEREGISTRLLNRLCRQQYQTRLAS
ncbi:hypothetical protein IC617_13735 [Neiella sp. HB171785]|uniref:Uncharacterized protein n=1 Tax=Neiella litorisoli TaxID=2771431 RepID=A0A8J6UQ78_9GAMM|nr:hypothetical protein [Neiella litorisoli]MBD1390497.1 hypothetical protein [Neiella litorisoli]